jgi:uncharacterized protein
LIQPRLVLFARYPAPGQAKTRLIPALGADGAAAVHRALTERTLACLAAAGEVELRFTGADSAAFAAWLGDVALVAQIEGGLTERLIAALDPPPVIFFGADTPDLTADIVEAAVRALETHDGVIGPAEDGGYYSIGLAAPHPALFERIDWSTERVFAQTMAKAKALGLDFAVLPRLADCDRPEDLARWPWLTA